MIRQLRELFLVEKPLREDSRILVDSKPEDVEAAMMFVLEIAIRAIHLWTDFESLGSWCSRNHFKRLTLPPLDKRDYQYLYPSLGQQNLVC